MIDYPSFVGRKLLSAQPDALFLAVEMARVLRAEVEPQLDVSVPSG